MNIDNDNTRYKWEPETKTDSFWQFNILYENGDTDGGFDDLLTAQNMLQSQIDAAASTSEEDNVLMVPERGELSNAVFIKREIVTTISSTRRSACASARSSRAASNSVDVVIPRSPVVRTLGTNAERRSGILRYRAVVTAGVRSKRP